MFHRFSWSFAPRISNRLVRTVANLLPSDSRSQHLQHSSQVPSTIIGAYALRFMHPPPSLQRFTSFFATYHMHAHGRNICFGLKKRTEEEERISVGRLSEIHTQDSKGRAGGWRRRVTILLEFSSVQGSRQAWVLAKLFSSLYAAFEYSS